ncbi:tetratricopeptide repeat protein [Streptomyces lichenis]|uniref:Tetratricopeptide repeat protein n=1 Tax=Streptomyces lichenis TaxID=2306967 RepID=A0ABT0I544_9ACTN|nr:tetratricopeptide repeat protein [Streptomyces lichenis]MCK8676438.1 tetratricopeptide repeat protein [Streptomyces lichenis]
MTQPPPADLAEVERAYQAGRFEEARKLLVALSAAYPGDAETAYRAASVHDRLGLEAEAVPYYERCLRGAELSDASRRGALLGLGSTYRVLGRYEEAVDTLRRGAERYPEDGALRAFLAMALYNTGGHHEATALLLRLLAGTSGDETVRAYRRAIEHYAGDLDATV